MPPVQAQQRIADTPATADQAAAATRAPAPRPTAPRTRITTPLIVDIAWLRANIDDVTIIDVRGEESYDAGHIPGAHAAPARLLAMPSTARPQLAELAVRTRSLLAGAGISPDSKLVVLDDGSGIAALVATYLEHAGARHVSVLLGSGFHDWREHGGDVDVSPACLVDHEVREWPGANTHARVLAAFEDIVDAVTTGGASILDVRAQLEHEGILGTPCCRSRGAIPGSMHLEWSTLFDLTGQPLAAKRVAAKLGELGIERGDAVIVTCHTGTRAAIAARVLRSAGFLRVRVAPGGWHEWALRTGGAT